MFKCNIKCGEGIWITIEDKDPRALSKRLKSINIDRTSRDDLTGKTMAQIHIEHPDGINWDKLTSIVFEGKYEAGVRETLINEIEFLDHFEELRKDKR